MDSTTEDQLSTSIDFQDSEAGVRGQDRHGRSWHILEERSGWRLTFRDPGDSAATNAGVFGTLAAAQIEAGGHQRR